MGECYHEGHKRPFLSKINLEDETAETIKILSIEQKITAINYGPYDNGYLLLGIESGQLWVFDVITLNRIQSLSLFQSAITNISFEPTSVIFIGS